jgi:hypothetical protein
VKIAVYTIALNEAAHAERWAESAADADYRILADTGSTDDTVGRLTRAGVTVHRIAVRPPVALRYRAQYRHGIDPVRCRNLLHN